MKKILVILGTRPEAIKLAPVIHALSAKKETFATKICDTGQHQELKQAVLDFFEICPNYQLHALQHSQTLSGLTAYLLEQLPRVFDHFQPDLMLVQGDTASAFAGSLVAFHTKIKIAHVEAGLRTHQKNEPFPEEMYRTMISRLADVHFAPTELAQQNLLLEGIPSSMIEVVGNTVVDALQLTLTRIQQQMPPSVQDLQEKIIPWRQRYSKMILFTLHRRENLENHLTEIGAAVRVILQRQDCFALFPVHLNPAVQHWAQQLAEDLPNLRLIEPLAYEAFVWAMQQCDLILTDSGGVQEEAPTLGKPVIVLRAHTERPEAQAQGTVVQVSIDRAAIIATAEQFLKQHSRNEQTSNPFGDGMASKKIVAMLEKWLL